jgi:molybdopterin converting factor small subunit
MIVSISFNRLQRKVTSRDQFQVTLSDKTRVTDLLSYVQECYPGISINRDAILVFINNKLSNLEQFLKEDDQICFMPHIGGG